MAYTYQLSDEFYIEIHLVYPDGTAETVRMRSTSRPWANDGVLFVHGQETAPRTPKMRQHGFPMLHVRSFSSEVVYPED